jgi:hypothetical protein
MDPWLEDIRRGSPRLGKSLGVTSAAGTFRYLPAQRAAQVDPLVQFEPE